MESDPRMQITEWSPEQMTQVLSDDFFSDVKKILVNGNYGDIVKHSRPKELMQAVIDKGVHVEVRTNGGALSPVFWKWLGEQPDIMIEFGIDGLADTHHLYRRNTRFDVVMRNAKAFIDAGGKASWAMTIFKHNEHQIDDCRALATEYGFSSFKERPTTRWAKKDLMIVDKHFNEEYRLEPATSMAARFAHLKKDDADVTQKDFLDSSSNQPEFNTDNMSDAPVLPQNDIECVVQNSSSVYLSADKKMWPCCWVAFNVQNAVINNYSTSSTDKFYKELGYGLDFNNVLLHSIDTILASGLFTEIEKSWSSNPIDECSRMCGKKGSWKVALNSTKVVPAK
jgi:sulfatase maturation enzyme AslB (radical SAM superfamily)